MVDKDGSWTTTDRVGDRRTGRLTDDQRAALRNLAADRRLAYESTRVQGPTNNFGVDRQTVQWYAEQPAPDMTLKLVGAVGRKP
jgi:hypothetical protein